MYMYMYIYIHVYISLTIGANLRQHGERAPLALTPEELQSIFQDWQALVADFEVS